ncbi:uncharacterized [Lates japonicus]
MLTAEPEPRTGRRRGCSSGLSAAHRPAEEIKQSRLTLNRRIKLVLNKPIRGNPVPEAAPAAPLLRKINQFHRRRKKPEPLNPHKSSAAPAASCRSAAIRDKPGRIRPEETRPPPPEGADRGGEVRG